MDVLYYLSWAGWVGLQVWSVMKLARLGIHSVGTGLTFGLLQTACILAHNLNWFVGTVALGEVALSIVNWDTLRLSIGAVVFSTVADLILYLGCYGILVWSGTQIGVQPIVF